MLSNEALYRLSIVKGINLVLLVSLERLCVKWLVMSIWKREIQHLSVILSIRNNNDAHPCSLSYITTEQGTKSAILVLWLHDGKRHRTNMVLAYHMSRPLKALQNTFRWMASFHAWYPPQITLVATELRSKCPGTLQQWADSASWTKLVRAAWSTPITWTT